MIARHLRWVAGAAALAGLLLLVSTARAQDKKADDKLGLDKIPKAVMDALKARFPKAEIHKWTKETEKGDVIYDIEFKQERRKCEADIKENGTYINFEREVAAGDLPAAVKKTVETKYPKAALKEIMEIMEVKGKDEKREGYEIVLDTADKKEVEITVAPDGKILEEPGTKKEESK